MSDSSDSLEQQCLHTLSLEAMTRSIADDLAKAMIMALDAIREDRKESDQSMVEEFSRCLTQMSEEFNSSIKKMVENFHCAVRDMAGDEIDRFSGQLRELHDVYVNANGDLVDSNKEMLGKVVEHSDGTLKQTKDITTLLNESTLQIERFTNDLYVRFDKLQKEMQQWVFATLEDSSNVIRSDLASVGSTLKDGAKEAGGILVDNAGLAGKALDNAGYSINQSIDTAASNLSESLNHTKEQLASGAEIASEKLVKAGDSINQAIDIAAGNLSESLNHTKEQLASGAEMASEKLVKAGDSINQAIDIAAGNLSESLNHTKEQLASGAEIASEKLVKAGDSINQAIDTAAGNLSESLNHTKEQLTSGVESASDKLVTAGDNLSQKIDQAAQNINTFTGSLEEQVSAAIDETMKGASQELKSGAAIAGNELVAAGQTIVNAFDKGSESITNKVDDVSNLLKDGAKEFVENTKTAGQILTEDMHNSVSDIALTQKAFTERHEKAVESMLDKISNVTSGIHETSKEVFDEWSDKVADASTSLVLASKQSADATEHLKPILLTQEKITSELCGHVADITKASEQSLSVQQQLVKGLEKTSDSYSVLADSLESTSDIQQQMEDQLQILTEEIASQHNQFAETIQKQLGELSNPLG